MSVQAEFVDHDYKGNHAGTIRTISSDVDKDAFGRKKVSAPFPVFENKNITHRSRGVIHERTAVSGTIAYDQKSSSVLMTAIKSAGSYAFRQTVRYLAYVPGNSTTCQLTGVLNCPAENLSLVVRSTVTGSVVDTVIPRANWNTDLFDQKGPSKILIDGQSKQIFYIDFQWLGVGVVRFGFDAGESRHPKLAHVIDNANSGDLPYMRTPTLPVRYEVRWDDANSRFIKRIGYFDDENGLFFQGTDPSDGTVREICMSIKSEGGYILPGLEYSASSFINGGLPRVTSIVEVPIFAMRIKTSLAGLSNRHTARLNGIGLWADANTQFTIRHVHDPGAITTTGGGPATWISADADGAVEVSRDLTAIADTPGVSMFHTIKQVLVGVSVGSSTQATTIDTGAINEHSFISQNVESNNSQLFVVYARTFAGAGTAAVSMDWIEVE